MQSCHLPKVALEAAAAALEQVEAKNVQNAMKCLTGKIADIRPTLLVKVSGHLFDKVKRQTLHCRC